MFVGVWGVVHARFEFLAEGGGVDAGTDQDELGEAGGRGLPGFRVEAEEAADGVYGVPVGQVVRAEVDVPLDPVQPFGPAVEEPHQATRVEGASAVKERLS